MTEREFAAPLRDHGGVFDHPGAADWTTERPGGEVSDVLLCEWGAILIVLYYTTLSDAPLWKMILISVVMFATITGRMASAGALTSAVPAALDRGAYMSITSSLQQLAGGIAAFLAGLIVYQGPTGRIEHYPRLGLVVATTTLLAIWLMYRVHRLVPEPTTGRADREIPARG